MKKIQNKMRNPRCEIRNINGFSLIELVFAMSFLTLIIFGVISLMSSNLALVNRQNNQIQAHFYANQGLQIVKAISYNNITCNPIPCKKGLTRPGNTYSLTSAFPETITNTIFERHFIIDDNGLTNAFLVRSIIEWEDSTGKHSIAEGNSQVESKIIVYQP